MKPSSINRIWLFLIILILSSYSCTKETIVSEKITTLPKYEETKQKTASFSMSESSYNGLKLLFESNKLNIADFQIERYSTSSSSTTVDCIQYINGYPVLSMEYFFYNEKPPLTFVFDTNGKITNTIGYLLTDTAKINKYKKTAHLTNAKINSCILSEATYWWDQWPEPERSQIFTDVVIFTEFICGQVENNTMTYKLAYTMNLKQIHISPKISFLE